jgi:hypothetical protein
MAINNLHDRVIALTTTGTLITGSSHIVNNGLLRPIDGGTVTETNDNHVSFHRNIETCFSVGTFDHRNERGIPARATVRAVVQRSAASCACTVTVLISKEKS